MSALSGKQIRERLELDDLGHRLVISPILESSEQLRDDQASIDIRLGFEFAFITPSAYGSIDEMHEDIYEGGISSLSDLFNMKYVPLGDSITIHPHQFVLASTMEYIRLPCDILAYVVGRSTWGRLGLIVATAVGIHPGFAGTLTLELRNLGEAPLTLYPGQAIAQLFLHAVESPDNDGSGIGQYSGSVDILPRKMSSSITSKKLKKLQDK